MNALKTFTATLRGDGLKSRAIRSTAWTILHFGGANFLRLLSNLVLTRLLFPEAFGLMALVQVMLSGLEMISDLGVNLSILQSKRGEEPAFLNTAWTVQIIRGCLTWVIILFIASPVAAFYEEPQLEALLMVTSLAAIAMALQSTNTALANRNLALGRLMVLDIGTQVFGIVVMIAVAWWTQSVWALVSGWLSAAILRTILSHIVMPGPRNRLMWDTSAFLEIFHFGKYIFISSTAGFVIRNADRAALGKFVSVAELGIYNIGYFLATVPFIVGGAMIQRVLIPIYVKAPPWEDPANLAKVRKARFLLGSVLLGGSAVLALIGPWLVNILYEDVYRSAGAIVVIMALVYMPTISFSAYHAALLANGNSRTFTVLQISTAVVQLGVLYFGFSAFGLLGAIIAPGVATLVTYPMMARFAARQNVLDLKVDLILFTAMTTITVIVLLVHPDAVTQILSGQLQ